MPNRLVWGHIGATIGRETRGIEGNRRDVKPQVKGHFTSSFLVAKVLQSLLKPLATPEHPGFRSRLVQGAGRT
jgi:hypothetical protein